MNCSLADSVAAANSITLKTASFGCEQGMILNQRTFGSATAYMNTSFGAVSVASRELASWRDSKMTTFGVHK